MMMIFLGDEVTLVKNEAWVTGKVSGIVLNDKKQIERVHLHDIEYTFWLTMGWKFVEEEEYEVEEDEI